MLPLFVLYTAVWSQCTEGYKSPDPLFFLRYFRQELERLDEGLRKEDMAVHVRRDHVFEDSYRELHRKSPEDMKNRL